jgi:hypothetical protein
MAYLSIGWEETQQVYNLYRLLARVGEEHAHREFEFTPSIDQPQCSRVTIPIAPIPPIQQLHLIHYVFTTYPVSSISNGGCSTTTHQTHAHTHNAAESSIHETNTMTHDKGTYHVWAGRTTRAEGRPPCGWRAAASCTESGCTPTTDAWPWWPPSCPATTRSIRTLPPPVRSVVYIRSPRHQRVRV